jgi:hypothetical protein
MKSEPPWISPPPDIAQDAIDHFIAEHKDYLGPPFGANYGKKSSDVLCRMKNGLAMRLN